MQKEILKVKDYVVCINTTHPPLKSITLNKIYIIYKCYENHNGKFFKIKNDIFSECKGLVSIFTYRFKKATKEDINNNLVDIVHRKLKDAI